LHAAAKLRDFPAPDSVEPSLGLDLHQKVLDRPNRSIQSGVGVDATVLAETGDFDLLKSRSDQQIPDKQPELSGFKRQRPLSDRLQHVDASTGCAACFRGLFGNFLVQWFQFPVTRCAGKVSCCLVDINRHLGRGTVCKKLEDTSTSPLAHRIQLLLAVASEEFQQGLKPPAFAVSRLSAPAAGLSEAINWKAMSCLLLKSRVRFGDCLIARTPGAGVDQHIACDVIFVGILQKLARCWDGCEQHSALHIPQWAVLDANATSIAHTQ